MTSRLLIGPANYAGQATEFARAIRREGLADARSAALLGRGVTFPADYVLPAALWALDPGWRHGWRRHVERTFDPVVIDGGLPLTRGNRHLADLGQTLRGGVLFRGSETGAKVVDGSDIVICGYGLDRGSTSASRVSGVLGET